MSNLRRLDLNLLVTLDALLTEHNVTRVAEKLNFSQPSISVHLSKLRDIFDDPLLLPGPRGMLPTAKAEALREPLRQALNALEGVVAPTKPFEPATAQNDWAVSAADYGESTVVLPVLIGLRAVAPNTRLSVIELAPAKIAKQLEQGEIDIAFHVSDEAAPELHLKKLFSERYVLAGRRKHPQLSQALTPAQFCDLEHVIVSPSGGGFCGVTDEALAQAGLTRRVVLSVPHFLFVKSVLASTDLVAMLPLRLAIASPELQYIEPPMPIAGYEMSMLWHELSHRDPAHRWLRDFIVEQVQSAAHITAQNQ